MEGSRDEHGQASAWDNEIEAMRWSESARSALLVLFPPRAFVLFCFYLHFVDHCHISRIIDHLNAFIFENSHLMMHLRREINKEKDRKKD
jgi:hypothetical protein